MAGALPINGGGMKAASGARTPGLVIAPCGLARTGSQRRAVGTDRRRRAGRVPDMRLFPGVGFVVFLGRRHVDCMVKPAVPPRRRHRGLGNPVIDHPSPLKPERRIDAWLAIVGVAEFVMPHELAIAAGVEARVEVRAVPPGEPVQQEFLDPVHPSPLLRIFTPYRAGGTMTAPPRSGKRNFPRRRAGKAKSEAYFRSPAGRMFWLTRKRFSGS